MNTNDLTQAGKEALCRGLWGAYWSGWNGLLRQITKRPYIMEPPHGPRVNPKTIAKLQDLGLVCKLKSSNALPWYWYFTKKGVQVAEEMYPEVWGEGSSIHESIAKVKAERSAEDREIDAKRREAKNLFRGLNLRQFGGRRKAISSLIDEEHVRDGYSIRLDLDDLVDLGRQIERLRADA